MGYKDREKQRAYQRDHYAKNKDLYKARASTGAKYMRAFVQSKKQVPCMDCGEQYPYYVMDFDHRPGETKVAMVSRLVTIARRADVEAEIAKCDVVCANCHRIRTHTRR